MKGFALSLWENYSKVLTYFDQFTFTLAQFNYFDVPKLKLEW